MASNRENETLEQSARRVLVLQAILAAGLIVLVVLYQWITGGMQQGLNQGFTARFNGAVGIGYGAILGILGTLLSKRSVDRSSQAVYSAPRFAMVPVYMGFMNKLLIVGGGLAVGMVILGLGPIYVVSGYLVTQLAYLATALKLS